MAEATIRELTVPAGAPRARVDRVVADLSGLSRSYVQKLISNGGLTQDGVPLHSNDVIEPGARLRLVVPATVPLELAPGAPVRRQFARHDSRSRCAAPQPRPAPCRRNRSGRRKSFERRGILLVMPPP